MAGTLTENEMTFNKYYGMVVRPRACVFGASKSESSTFPSASTFPSSFFFSAARNTKTNLIKYWRWILGEVKGKINSKFYWEDFLPARSLGKNLKYFQTKLKINIEELKVNWNLTRLSKGIRQPDGARAVALKALQNTLRLGWSEHEAFTTVLKDFLAGTS